MASKVDWAAYDKSLIQRGSITFWLCDDVMEAWYAKPSGKRGRQETYSDIAIETALTLRSVFGQGLRQTEGLLISLFQLMSIELSAPDHSTLSRRSSVLKISIAKTLKSNESITIAVDSTGLKIFGSGEWCETKHGLNKRRQWRKLHITLNTSTLEVVEATLTENSVGDSREAKNHLKAIDNEIDEMLADGAYDCQEVYNNIEEGDGLVTIPPPINAVVSKSFPKSPTQRDKHVTYMNQYGRAGLVHSLGHFP
jgi:hypothetical protein